MSPAPSAPPHDANEEVGALIKTLQQAEQRLKTLTGGELDSVADAGGRTFLLQHAQEQLVLNEGAKQAAILNALPAHIALLDPEGQIISVNEAWRQYADSNALQGPGHGLGLNYLDACDSAAGNNSAEAHQVAAGIRAILSGKEKRFLLEYPCHSPTEQSWFLLSVMPLPGKPPQGAVVMHVNVTAERQAEEKLRISESRFRQMAENIRDVFFLIDAQNGQFLYISPAYEEVWGLSCESLYADPESWVAAIHPEDRAATYEGYKQGVIAGNFELTYRIVRADASIRWIEAKAFPVQDLAGKYVRITGICIDVTEQKRASLLIKESEQRLALATESAHIGIWDWNVVADHMTWDAQMYALYGIRDQDFSGAYDAWQKGLHPNDRARAEAEVAAALAGIEDFRSEFRVVWPNGEIHHIQAHGLVQRTENGTAVRMIGVNWDNTQRKNAEQALRDSEALHRIAGRTAQLGGWAVDLPELRILWSDEVCAIHEVPPGTIPSLEQALSFYPPQSHQIITQAFMACTEHGTAFDLKLQFVTARGQPIWVRATGEAQRDAAGVITRVQGAFQDITEQQKADIRINYLNRVYAMLSGINMLIVRVKEREELFNEACRIAVHAGGFRMALIGALDPASKKIVPVASAGMTAPLLNIIKDLYLSDAEAVSGNSLIAHVLRDKKAVISNDSQHDADVMPGNEYAAAGVCSLALLPLINADTVIGVLVLYASEMNFFHQEEIKLLEELAGDIAFGIDHIEKQDQLNYLAYYDALTGLANRSLFHNRLEQSLHAHGKEQPQVTTVLIDLARFRQVNETLGRTAGDELLRQAGSRLLQANDSAARISGDMFGLIMQGAQTATAVNRTLKTILATCFKEPFALGAENLLMACHAGIALYPADGTDADTLLRNAEAALRQSKHSTEPIVFYASEMNARVAEALTIESDLRRAIDRREFVLHYQPKISLANGRLVGMEALLRWQNPAQGLVPPGNFIPVLEQTGMIVEVGRWVVEQALADLRAWSAHGLLNRIIVPRIAVNVSALQLQNKDFVHTMIEEIHRSGDHPEWLELEITESMVMGNVDASIHKLAILRGMGVTVAIDDFGTGYSSLNYLSRLPLDALKIDQSFVSSMTKSEESASIVSTIITLAHGLKLKVVAEGVETEAQSAMLKQLGCDQVQGYLYSKPLPSDPFAKKYLVSRPATEH